MPFRHDHDAGIFRPNGVSRRTPNGMKALNPRCFGVWGVVGKKAEVKNPNRVSAKCAIYSLDSPVFMFILCRGAAVRAGGGGGEGGGCARPRQHAHWPDGARMCCPAGVPTSRDTCLSVAPEHVWSSHPHPLTPHRVVFCSL
jgi:hypothetical protein